MNVHYTIRLFRLGLNCDIYEVKDEKAELNSDQKCGRQNREK